MNNKNVAPSDNDYLMTNILENIRLQVPDMLVPPVLVLRSPVLPVPHLELAQLGGEVHEGDGDHLGLPLQAQGSALTTPSLTGQRTQLAHSIDPLLCHSQPTLFAGGQSYAWFISWDA